MLQIVIYKRLNFWEEYTPEMACSQNLDDKLPVFSLSPFKPYLRRGFAQLTLGDIRIT